MQRINRTQLHLHIASLVALRGQCGRAKVGAVLTMDNRIIATGYNGTLENSPDCIPGNCDITQPCKRAIHAEANIIAFCSKNGIATDGAVLYCTHSPCVKCAELIVQAGITKVIYITPFRDTTGISVLENKVTSCQVNLESLQSFQK